MTEVILTAIAHAHDRLEKDVRRKTCKLTQYFQLVFKETRMTDRKSGCYKDTGKVD